MSWSYSKWSQRQGPLHDSWLAERDRELHRIGVAPWMELRDLASWNGVRWRWWHRVITSGLRRELLGVVKTRVRPRRAW